MPYVGLTDDPEMTKQELANPGDFSVVCTFETEAEARLWQKEMLARGYEGDSGGEGWKYGYTF